MSTVLAVTTPEPDPHVPLLSEVIAIDPAAEAQRKVQQNLQHEIDLVTSNIANRELRQVSQTILGELVRFFEWLARIETNLHKLDTLLESLSLLEVLEFEARSLVD